MSVVTPQQMEALEPYAAGAKPDDRGELEIYCPLHEDSRRSASVNVHRGVWYCHAGCGGGTVRQLVLAEDVWVPLNGRVHSVAPRVQVATQLPTMDQVTHWHRRLRRERKVRRRLWKLRGLTLHTVRKARLGWSGTTFKIPVLSPRRRLWNVRNYDPDPKPGRSKIWNTRGMGQARLYPIGVLDRVELGDAVLFCEGELDTLLALQCGYNAVTRTDGAGKPWHDEWTHYFAGLRVFMCHDLDRAGVYQDSEMSDALSDVAQVFQCHLPFTYKEKHGNDLTDYLLLERPRERGVALGRLLQNATKG